MKENKIAAIFLLVLVLSATGDADVVHTGPECFDVACDRSPSDFDQSNVLDEVLGSKTCEQCQEHGYSVCLRPLNSSSNGANGSDYQNHSSTYSTCKHFVPTDCEEYIHHIDDSSHPNSSKILQNLCYVDVVHELLMPEVRDDNGTIFVDIDPFWNKSYWKPFRITNFTLHSTYTIENPESCEGTAVGHNGTYECEWEKTIQVPSEEDAKVDSTKIPRQTIAADFITFWYSVVLIRPRQFKHNRREMETFVTITTKISSQTTEVDLAAEEEENSLVAMDRVPVDHSHDHDPIAIVQHSQDIITTPVIVTLPTPEETTTATITTTTSQVDHQATTRDHHQTESGSIIPEIADHTTTTIHKPNEEHESSTTHEPHLIEITDDDEHEEEAKTTTEHYQIITTSFSEEDEEMMRNNAENDATTTLKWILAILLLSVFVLLLLVLACNWRTRICPCLPTRYKYNPTGESSYRYHAANEEIANSIPLSGYNRPLLLDDGLPEMQDYRDLLGMCPMFLPVKLELKNGVGEGRFGIIYKGSLLTKEFKSDETTVHCAKSPFRMRIEDARIFLETLSPTAKAGSHQNVVSLMGICDQDERLLICMEPLTNADLQVVLREGRTIKSEIVAPSGTVAPTGQTYHQTASLMSVQRLLRLMLDCAQGTAHLDSRSVLHPHLAACNVLVGERGIAKISGFGFATHRNLYSREHEPRLSTIRWQAPETLAGDEYGIHSHTTKTQAWSLGVLLWEICSLGGTPYAHIESSVQFLTSIQSDAAKLQKPSYVGEELYTILERCFNHDSTLRPSSEMVVSDLRAVSANPNPQINLTLNGNNSFVYPPIKTHLEHVTQFQNDK